jgi:hypothetical protein
MTDFMVGDGYFMGLSGGVYKMAVGRPWWKLYVLG